jgi:hypothetical protein
MFWSQHVLTESPSNARRVNIVGSLGNRKFVPQKLKLHKILSDQCDQDLHSESGL